MSKKLTKTKVTKLSPKQLQDLIWVECRRIIKVRYPSICYTCGAAPLVGANRHTGHLISKKYLHNYLKYDLRVLRPQCYFCNIHAGGMGAMFVLNMIEREGEKYVKSILKDMGLNLQPKEAYKFYEDTLAEYKLIEK